MADPLTPDQVRKVALLSRLELSDEQITQRAEQLDAVLGYIERLGELDLAGVEPMAHPLDVTNRFDEDEPRDGLPTSALMKMAPDAHEPFIKVPKVLGDGGGA